jgi:two-component system sensor histidine kinase TctE
LKGFRQTEKQHRQTSLFGEILDWMLTPFLVLWPISMAVEYSIAYSVASSAYDRELKDSVVVLSRQVSFDGKRIQFGMPASAVAMLQARGSDETLYQVRDLKNEIVAGEPRLPVVEFSPELEPQTVYFRNDHANNSEDLRVAYMFAQVPGLTGALLVQVAETEGRRVQLASEISSAVLSAQFLILPLALVMVSLGLAKGIAPLNELRDKIRNRKSQDLSPIDPAEAPEEVRPFIHSINDLMQRLDASLRAQQRFVADAAHQMRTPLAGLKTQAELALRQRGALGVEHTMRQIVVGADRATRLVNQLLALARADSDMPASIARLDLDRLTLEVAREWVSRAMDKHIDLGFEAAQAPCYVEGNEVLLRELLANLFDNAIRYTGAGGHVTARVIASEAIILEVADNGIGIDASDRERVFERFYRVLGTDTEGSGLGLAIVRSIAEVHRAQVELDLNPQGSGTVVRVAFPLSRADPRPLRTAA